MPTLDCSSAPMSWRNIGQETHTRSTRLISRLVRAHADHLLDDRLLFWPLPLFPALLLLTLAPSPLALPPWRPLLLLLLLPCWPLPCWPFPFPFPCWPPLAFPLAAFVVVAAAAADVAAALPPSCTLSVCTAAALLVMVSPKMELTTARPCFA